MKLRLQLFILWILSREIQAISVISSFFNIKMAQVVEKLSHRTQVHVKQMITWQLMATQGTMTIAMLSVYFWWNIPTWTTEQLTCLKNGLYMDIAILRGITINWSIGPWEVRQ